MLPIKRWNDYKIHHSFSSGHRPHVSLEILLNNEYRCVCRIIVKSELKRSTAGVHKVWVKTWFRRTVSTRQGHINDQSQVFLSRWEFNLLSNLFPTLLKYTLDTLNKKQTSNIRWVWYQYFLSSTNDKYQEYILVYFFILY